MANYTWDQFVPLNSGPSDPVTPVAPDVDWNNPIISRSQIGGEAPQEHRGDFSRGVSAGIDQLQGSAYGLLGLAGDALGSDALRDFGLAGYERNQQEAATVGPRVSSLKDVTGIGSFIDYTQGLLGQTTPFLATTAAGGGLGAVVARKAVEKMVAKGVSEQVAKKYVTKALANETLDKTMLRVMTKQGALLGSAGGSALSQQGDLYGRLKAEGIEDAVAPAFFGGLVQGGLDVLPEARLLGKFMPSTVEKQLAESLERGAKAAKTGKLEFAKGVGKQAALEGATEGAQEAVSVLARIYGDDTKGWSAQDVDNVLENFAAGAIVGTIIGAPGELLSRRAQKKPETKNAKSKPADRTQAAPAATAPAAEAPAPEAPVAGAAPSAGEAVREVPQASAPAPGPAEVVANEQPAPEPIQEPQAPAPSVEPAQPQPVDTARAPVGAAPVESPVAPVSDSAPESNAAPQDEALTPEQMQGRAASLRDEIARFKAREPTDGAIESVPTAEPAADLQAQIRDLQDDTNPRRGVFFSADNVEQNGDMLNSLKGFAKVRNVDGRGGVLVMKLRDVAEFKARSEKGESRDALIGEYTRAGEGKPLTDNPVVLQQKDETGAVTAESVVDGNDPEAMQARAAEYEQEGRTVEAVDPVAALERRATESAPAGITAKTREMVLSENYENINSTQDAMKFAQTVRRDFDALRAKRRALNESDQELDENDENYYYQLLGLISDENLDLQSFYKDAPEYRAMTPKDRADFDTRFSNALGGISAEVAGGSPIPAAPKYDTAKTIGEFKSALEAAEFLSPENDGPESRLAKAKFTNWLLKEATPEQRAAYKAFKAGKRKPTDSNSVLLPDEIVPLNEEYGDTPEERDAKQQFGERTQSVEAILGKGGVIHGTKRVRSKAERVDPRKYKSPEYQAEAWTGDDGELRAERLAASLNEIDDHSFYEEREVNAKEAEERGLAGPGWYVFQFSKDSSGPLERNYAKNYGASLTVPQVIMVGLARAKERWDKLSPSDKSPNNPQRWGVELASVSDDGKRKARMVAAKELTEIGLQADPALRNIDNFNARVVAGFFHGVSLLYAGKAKWVPSTSNLSEWLSPNTIIAESGGKKVTLGDALIRDEKGKAALSQSEKEVIRNLSGRDFGVAWGKLVQRRFENALRLGAPAAVAKRKAVEADIAARRTMKRVEGLIDGLDKELAKYSSDPTTRALNREEAELLRNRRVVAFGEGPFTEAEATRLAEIQGRQSGSVAKYNKLRLRRATLQAELNKAEKRIGSVGYDPSADNELRRKILDEVADQTEEDIYIPPEEVPLEHQDGDYILNKLESEDDQARRSAKQSFTNDPFTSRAGDSAIGTIGAGAGGQISSQESSRISRLQSEGARSARAFETKIAEANIAQLRASIARLEERRKARGENGASTKALDQTIADQQEKLAEAEFARSAELKPDAMEDGWFKTEKPVEAPTVERDGLSMQIADPVRASGSEKLVRELKQYFALDTNFYVTDSLDSLVKRLRKDGLGATADQVIERTTATNGGWSYPGTNGTAYVYANPVQGNAIYIKGLSHEVGHILDAQYFRTTPKEMRNELRREWLAAKKSTDAYTRKRANRGFHEWRADQLAAWVAGNEQARTLVETYFEKIADVLRKAWARIQELFPLNESFNEYLTGIARAAERARKVNEANLESLGGATNLAADEMPNPDTWSQVVKDRARAIKTKYKTVDSSLNFIGESAMAMHNSLIASLQARIRRMNIPAFNQLLSMFYLRPGQAGGFTYDSAVANRHRNFMQQFSTIIENVDESLHSQLHDFLQTEKPTEEAPAEIREAVAQFREFVKRTYAYQRDAHMPIREVKNYFPRVFDTEELLKDDAVDTLFNAIRAAGFKIERSEVVDMIANGADDSFAVDFDPGKLEDAEGNLRSPFQQALRSRTLPQEVYEAIQNIKDENGKSRFYAKDLRTVMYRYIRQATRRAEFNKILGDTTWDTQDNGKFDVYRKFRELTTQAKQQGATPEQMELMYDSMSAFLGQYGRIKSEPLRKLTRSVAFYQQLRTLGLVVFSSIPEFANLFLRPGNFGDTWSSVRRSAADAFNSDGRSYELLRQYGFAVDEHDSLMFSDIKDAQDFGGVISRASEGFFRMVGLTKWTNFMRGLSLNVSLDYVKRHAQAVAEGRDDSGDSARRLEELGVSVEDVRAWAAAGEPVYGTRGFTSEDLRLGNSELTAEQLESVRKMTGAVARMVNEMVLDPKAGDKPLWRSDERFALVAQLSSYMYAFTTKILGRAWYELTRDGATTVQRATIVASLGLMVALTALGLELKELLQYKLWGNKAPTDDYSAPKYMANLITRSGVLGIAQLGVDATSAAGANKSPLLAFLGPTLGQVSDAFTQPASKTLPGAIPFISQVPGLREPLREALK